MEYYVNAAQMKRIDGCTINTTGIPSLILMEQAATYLSDCVQAYIREHCSEKYLRYQENMLRCPENHEPFRITIFAGTGNNGADGLACARILASRGYKTECYSVGKCDKTTEEWKKQAEILDNLEIPNRFLKEEDLEYTAMCSLLSDTAVIVDGIFGIGLGREVGGMYKTLIEVLNRISVPKIAIDIPSGIYASTGQIAGVALACTETVTFGREKTGQHIYPGKSYCGRLCCAPLGFSPAAYKDAGYEVRALDFYDVAGLLPFRPQDGHKGTFGKVLVIAGCDTMAGAAIFSAKAAYRSGAGLVRIRTVESNRDVILNSVPEAVLSLYNSSDLKQEELINDLNWADAVVFGPGIGRASYVARMLKVVLEFHRGPLIIDADGIRELAEHPELHHFLSKQVILTPHIGEMSALTGLSGGGLLADPIHAAGDAAGRFHCTIVMKSAVTVIAAEDEITFLEDKGTNALGTAGSGDVLTGIIAAMAGGGLDPVIAAGVGAAVHALSGAEAGRQIGARSVTATDILEGIRIVLDKMDKQLLD